MLMLDTSLQPAQISAEESQLLAGMNTKEVFGWVMGKLAEDDELLTVAVADYGRRLNLDRFRELRPDGYIQCGIAEQNLIEVASACANEGFHVFAPCYATFCDLSNAGSDSRQPWHDEVARGACGSCRWLRIRSYRTFSHGGGGHCGNQDHSGAFRVQSD